MTGWLVIARVVGGVSLRPTTLGGADKAAPNLISICEGWMPKNFGVWKRATMASEKFDIVGAQGPHPKYGQTNS